MVRERAGRVEATQDQEPEALEIFWARNYHTTLGITTFSHHQDISILEDKVRGEHNKDGVL